LVISDADIAVGTGYLRDVVRPLAEDRVGMVTCLYRGAGRRGTTAVLEGLGMSAEFAAQVLLGRSLSGMRFGLGATMATRRKQLAEIGGLAPWLDYLADDYILGNRIAATGYRIYLSHTPVETLLPRRTWREFLHQQLRWARTIRACSPGGYVGLLFAFAAPLALIPAVFRPSTLTLSILAAALVLRLAAGWVTGVSVCRDKLVRRYFWLLPVRDLVALALWLLSFTGNRIVWRGTRYRLEPNGKIRPA
jgi:ceramide glucosyltransferase